MMDHAGRFGRKRDVNRYTAKAAREQSTKKDGNKTKWQTKKN